MPTAKQRLQNKKYKGEMHAFLWKPTITNPFRMQRASYMGPGTNLYRRLLFGIKPKSKADRRAIVHDSQYALAKSGKDVRDADYKAVGGALWDMVTFQDNPWNAGQMALGLGLKAEVEKTGIIKPGDIGGYGDATHPEWRKVLEEVVSTGASDETLKKIYHNPQLKRALKQQRRQAVRTRKLNDPSITDRIKKRVTDTVKQKAGEAINSKIDQHTTNKQDSPFLQAVAKKTKEKVKQTTAPKEQANDEVDEEPQEEPEDTGPKPAPQEAGPQ